jgi:pyrroline-5-carboxylate reductase
VPQVLERAKKEGLHILGSDREVVDWADLIVVAVKPQVVDPVIASIAESWTPKKILVSICAGVTISQYEQGLRVRGGAKIVRIMPNTPCLIAEAATAYDGSRACDEWELELVHSIFAAVGRATHHVPEYLLNAVTGLSGSGPAYVYMLIQALSDAGVHGGLPRNVALSLATQTVIGAAKMVQQTETHPALLKEAVTSPAGTTIAGVRVLEKMNFSSAIIEAVEAARLRSEQLSDTPDFLFQKKTSSSMEPP